MLVGLLAGLVSVAPAGSQTPTPTEETRIYTFTVIPASGYAGINVLGGSDDSLHNALCSGRSPLGGPYGPLSVITVLQSHGILVRVFTWTSTGHVAPVNGKTVLVKCAIDAPTQFWESPATAAKAAGLRHAG
jgi:hypothetical protein